jgi:hypothetical protein
MRKGTFVRITMAAVAGLMVSSTTASALVLVEKSEEQKLRADIQKQQHGYVSCLVKAAANCEKSGAVAESECDLPSGTATPPADAKGKFAADIAKCDGKLNFLKKAKTLTDASAYTAIGCPGDSDSGTSGDQPYNLLSELQAATPAATKTQIQTLAAALGVLTGCNDEGTYPTAKDQNKCQAAEVKRIAGYAAAIQKCEQGCEVDYKDKKGNGGTTDTGVCSLNAGGTSGSMANAFGACVDKAYAKATKTPIPGAVGPVVLPQLATALNDANNDLNNENDCP